MSEDELITLMYKNKFSKKQIDNLIKLSEKYSTSLHETVIELARRFLRSLFVHLLTLFLTIYSYIQLSEKNGHSLGIIIFFTGLLCFFYGVFHVLAPLAQGYKAKRTLRDIQKKEKSQYSSSTRP
ncbi:hypothetical protein [Serratia marcescens]|uniref:hypothetical protein n=1 Tax=Serratia marcescens TaxID=615 RepID=UPI000E2B1083|nr:hypothetical protein [Serratia marcescens]